MTITLTWGAFKSICRAQGIRLVYSLSTGKVSKIVSLEGLYTTVIFSISPLSINENGFLDIYPGAVKIDDIV